MFRNYQELFSSAIQYYKTSLFSDDDYPTRSSGFLNATEKDILQQVESTFGYGLSKFPVGVESASAISSFITEEYGRSNNGFISGIYDGLCKEDMFYITSIFILFIMAKQLLSRRLRSSVSVRSPEHDWTVAVLLTLSNFRE